MGSGLQSFGLGVIKGQTLLLSESLVRGADAVNKSLESTAGLVGLACVKSHPACRI